MYDSHSLKKLLLLYNKVQISSLLYRSNNKKYLNYNHRCHLLNSIFSKNIWRVSNRVSSDASMHNFHSRNWQKNWQMSSQRNIHKAISICFPLKVKRLHILQDAVIDDQQFFIKVDLPFLIHWGDVGHLAIP